MRVPVSVSVPGLSQLSALLAPEACAEVLAALEPLHARARAAAEARGGGDAGFSVPSSSLCLGRCPGFDLLAWLGEARTSPLRQAVQAELGGAALLAPDQCWLRRQYPLAAAPPAHLPHGWHQDGALHADFSLRPLPPPLRMLTCWLALTPCGEQAPSLQWVDAALPELLPPAALSEAAVMHRYGGRRWPHATLAAGDALLFDGAVLHRTHCTPAMQAMRTSLELRWFAPDEALRLRNERLLAWA